MDYRALNLNFLVVLDALLEERGISAAARRLKISQPNVSFALGRLREFFGDELLVRQGNQMIPTPTGEKLREPIRRIVETIDAELFRNRPFQPDQSERRFAISTSDIGELVFLPKLLNALEKRAPGTSVRCYSIAPDELVHAMSEGVVDVALGYFPDLDGAAFYKQKLFEHPFICLVRTDHPSVGSSLSLDQFLGMDHLVVSQAGRSQELFERSLAQQGLTRRIQLQSPHFMSVPLLIANSDLITTVPKAVAATYADLIGLKALQPPLDLPPIELNQFWHRRVHRDPAIVWLRALISELFLGRDPSLPA